MRKCKTKPAKKSKYFYRGRDAITGKYIQVAAARRRKRTAIVSRHLRQV